jgi:hypothetical protein
MGDLVLGVELESSQPNIKHDYTRFLSLLLTWIEKTPES